MLFPTAIERGDEHHAYGVAVPDLPGCHSAGDTFEEAMANAKEAIEGWLEVAVDYGDRFPRPPPSNTTWIIPILKAGSGP